MAGSTSGGVDPKWRGDGKELFFLDTSDNLMAVEVDSSRGTPGSVFLTCYSSRLGCSGKLELMW
jgi:hypothetical protein